MLIGTGAKVRQASSPRDVASARVGGPRALTSPVERIGWLLPAFVLLLFVLRPLGPVKDPDAFWHIVAGQHLQQTGQFILNDPFGAGTENIWILNQWLPELLMHWANAVGGLAGVAWLLCLGSLLVGLAVMASARRRSSPLVAALVTAVAFVAMSGSLSPRPQLVTFAFAAITTSAWLLTREDLRIRWWLVPLTWLWACSHGMWFFGPVLGAIVILGLLAERRVSIGAAVRLALVPLLSVGVAALTPVGPRLFTSPFQVGEVTSLISEWQPAGLGDVGLLACLVLVGVVVFTQARRWTRDWVAVFLTLFALVLALSWGRTIAVAAVVLAPLVAQAVHEMMGQPPTVRATRRESWASGVAGILALGLVLLLAPGVAGEPGRGPSALDAPLAHLPTGTVVCNDQADGGWLMLRHPRLKPTMDTRVELYSVERIRHYLAFVSGADGQQTYVNEVRCAYAVLPNDARVVGRLTSEVGWVRVAEAGGYIMLGRR